MLSQLIVVDFTKGRHAIDYEALTDYPERVVSFCSVDPRPEFDLHLFNYDKQYTNKADTRLVFIHTHLHALGEAVDPWVSIIDLAYRRLLTATLDRVKHDDVVTICHYKCVVDQPPYTKHLNWIEKTISV